MPYPRHGVQLASDYAPDDWRLLIRLPAEVMLATIRVRDRPPGAAGDHHHDPASATPARHDPPRRTVAEGLAGLDAIAAGRGSDSTLVRAVVAAIYAEPEDDGIGPVSGPDGAAEQVFVSCRRVVEVLRRHADPSEADAYLAWVRQVAVRVCGAAHSGGVLGLGDDRMPEPQRAFLDGLSAALS